jgi:hypothetical protein
MPTSTLYDSINPAAIPAGVPAAGYVDGNWQSYDGLVKRNANPVVVPISAVPRTLVNCPCVIDQERSDYTPRQAVIAAAAHGGITLYTSRLGSGLTLGIDDPGASGLAICQAACKALSVDPTSFAWWIADGTGEPHQVPGAVATQWGQRAGCDLSMADDAWLATFAPTPTPPAPPLPKGINMQDVTHIPAAETANNQETFAYFDTNGHLIVIAWNGQKWVGGDLTTDAGATPAALT